MKRPATIRLPLPQWYIDRRNKPTESLEQASINDANMVSNAPVQYPTASEMTVPIQDKGLVILFQVNF
ncbi:unnamed protein product [Trichobilharzia regenti]|nr:unnamed protein product [Trichobilharzia regenti]